MADGLAAATIADPEADSGIDPDMRAPKPHAAPRPNGSATSSSAPHRRPRHGAVAADGFFRDLVRNLRNGVIAVTSDGAVAVMNEAAYQILGLKRRASDIGRPFTSVLKAQQDVCRIVASAFELTHLPNRAELRLKATGKVIG